MKQKSSLIKNFIRALVAKNSTKLSRNTFERTSKSDIKKVLPSFENRTFKFLNIFTERLEIQPHRWNRLFFYIQNADENQRNNHRILFFSLINIFLPQIT